MAIQYKPTKHAFKTEGDSLTEQEHKDSCDINKMIHSISRGQQVRGNPRANQYGYDDTTMDAVTFRIEKQRLEEQLQEAPKEIEKSVLDQMPQKVVQKFGFKSKALQNDETKTTTTAPIQADQQQPATTPEPPAPKS